MQLNVAPVAKSGADLSHQHVLTLLGQALGATRLHIFTIGRVVIALPAYIALTCKPDTVKTNCCLVVLAQQQSALRGTQWGRVLLRKKPVLRAPSKATCYDKIRSQ